MITAALIVGALIFAVCSDDGEDGDGKTGGITNPDGGNASPLVGDWTYIDDIEYNNSKGYITIKANGEFCFVDYQRVNDFWIEGTLCPYKWVADETNISLTSSPFWGSDKLFLKYTIMNNKLTIYSDEYDDYDDYNEIDTFWVCTKGSSKPKGTIRTTDPTLSMTDWEIEDNDKYGYLSFWGSWFSVSTSDNSYFDDYDYDYEMAYYINGITLYMLKLHEVTNTCQTENWEYEHWDETFVQEYNYDCAYTIIDQKEFTYTHTPGVSLSLVNLSLKINDTWVPEPIYDDYYYRSPLAKTRNVKRPLLNSLKLLQHMKETGQLMR